MRRGLILLLLALLAGLQYRLWIAEGGMGEVLSSAEKLEQHRAHNEKLQERNRQLEAQVEDLKSGLGALEELARSELGMVREGEVFYQVVLKPPAAAGSNGGPEPTDAATSPAANAEDPPPLQPSSTQP